jgi:hypothetical protein
VIPCLGWRRRPSRGSSSVPGSASGAQRGIQHAQPLTGSRKNSTATGMAGPGASTSGWLGALTGAAAGGMSANAVA